MAEALEQVASSAERVTVRPPPRMRRWPWFAAAGLGGALALSAGGLLSVRRSEEPATFHLAEQDEMKDGGTVAVGDSALPPPTQAEVERVVRHRVLRLLEKTGALPAQGPEDALQAYQAHSLQQRLRWTEVDVQPPPNKQPRCALLEGFSLHANTHLHANDRQGLERRYRYGARGALALARLSRAEDGRIAYWRKRLWSLKQVSIPSIRSP